MVKSDLKNIIYNAILPECERREGIPILDGEEFARMISDVAFKALEKTIPSCDGDEDD